MTCTMKLGLVRTGDARSADGADRTGAACAVDADERGCAA
jgi:hypothetical protein